MALLTSSLSVGQIYQGDCFEAMQRIEAGTIDLVFADPPFNIGYEYDHYHDRQDDEEYIAWSRQWMEEVHRVLKPGGTFWLAIGDEYAAELKVDAEHKIGFSTRSWVVWYYTFGVNCTKKFSRSHVHLFHFVKDDNNFTFNAEDPLVRVPSARRWSMPTSGPTRPAACRTIRGSSGRRICPTDSSPPTTCGTTPVWQAPLTSAKASTAAKCRSSSWAESFASAATRAISCSTRSRAAARRWPSPRNSAGSGLAANCLRSMSAPQRSGSTKFAMETNSTARPTRLPAPLHRRRPAAGNGKHE